MILEMIGLFEKRAAVMAFEGAFSAVDKRVSLDIRGTGTDVRTIGTTVTGLQGQDMKMGAVCVKAVDKRMSPYVGSAGTNVRTIRTAVTGLRGQDMKEEQCVLSKLWIGC